MKIDLSEHEIELIREALGYTIDCYEGEMSLGDMIDLDDRLCSIQELPPEIVPVSDARHPARQKAIEILEAIAKKLGNEDIFDYKDCRDGDTKWYDFEDMVTSIIAEEE